MQSLWIEDGMGRVGQLLSAGFVPFWAILESDVLPHIERALQIGDRMAALSILASNAKDGGSILD
ncbi:MAG: hypothetical protein IT422_06115 [Pirellulaceae bacterium]|nr:hypothetical protein [Pirellulaceae bacterium]